jgi:hypothetical protein
VEDDAFQGCEDEPDKLSPSLRLTDDNGRDNIIPPVIGTAHVAETLLHFGEMRHRAFRMLGRLVGVSGLAVGDGFL